jgi:uncharacterized protein DUF4424/YARHG domain-containing protein
MIEQSLAPTIFVGFATTVNGQQVHANVEQKAYLNDHDQTETLSRLGVPLPPYLFRDVSEKLPAIDNDQLRSLGLINEYGVPLLTLKTNFYWQQRFPSARETLVEHRYKPSVGRTVAVASSELHQWLQDDSYREYCIDPDFLGSLTRDRLNLYGQQRIEYVLKTGANWSGPIKEFRLLVDKGSPDNLVSFCGQDVNKISPTMSQMRKINYVPDNNLAILILKREPGSNSRMQTPNDVIRPPPSIEYSQNLNTQSCDDLWYLRNSIFKEAGYCFKTPRGIRTFGNAGCQFDNENDVPLSDRQRQTINQIRSLEAARRCAR